MSGEQHPFPVPSSKNLGELRVKRTLLQKTTLKIQQIETSMAIREMQKFFLLDGFKPLALKNLSQNGSIFLK